MLLRQGKVDEALLDIDRALELDPNNAYAYSQRGYIHKMQGDEPSANRDFEQGERIMQRRWAQDAVSEEVAQAELQRKLTGAETADSMVFRAWHHWGDSQDPSKPQNLNQMATRARHAIKLDAGHIGGHEALAVALYNLGKKSIFESNRDGLSDAQRGARRTAAQKHFEEAGKAADSALTLDPNNAVGLNIKGWTLNQLGRPTEGRQLTDAAQAAEARKGIPEARDSDVIVEDAHDSILFLEDAKQNITVVKDEETGISTVTYQTLNADGQPETVTRQMRGTDDQVQAAIDQEIRRQLDAQIAQHQESIDADRSNQLEVTDEDAPATTPETPTIEEQIADIERKIQNLNDTLQQTDGINRSQEIRQQMQELQQERDRLAQQVDDEIPFDAHDDETPPDAPPEDTEVARQPEIPSMPIEIVEEFYRYLKTNADANPDVAGYADSLGALTTDVIEELSKTRPELKDLFDAYNNAEQIVANHARANYIDHLIQKFGNAVDNVEEYQKLVDQVFDSTSIEDITEIKKGLSDVDAERLEGAFWQRTLDTWMRGGESKINEMLENGLLSELVGPERVEAINYFDNIVTSYHDAKERGRSVKQPTAEDARNTNAKLEQIAEGARQRAEEARAEEARIAEEIAESKAEIERIGTVDEAERLEGALESEENFEIAQQRLEKISGVWRQCKKQLKRKQDMLKPKQNL